MKNDEITKLRSMLARLSDEAQSFCAEADISEYLCTMTALLQAMSGEQSMDALDEVLLG